MNLVDVELFGQDLRIKKSLDFVKNLSVSRVPVLVVGEVGIGKKTLSRYIHENSLRNEKSFEVVDCSAPQDEVEKIF